MGLNDRLTYLGSEHISPILLEKSIEEYRIYYAENDAFGGQLPSLYYLDLSITYRKNKLNYSGERAYQVKNVLGSSSHEGYLYNFKTDNIQELKPVVIVPMISYKTEC